MKISVRIRVNTKYPNINTLRIISNLQRYKNTKYKRE